MTQGPGPLILLSFFAFCSGTLAAPSHVYYDAEGVPTLSSSFQPGASERAKLMSFVNQASAEYMIDPALLSAIITVESSWNVNAVSVKGAVGLMQLMPETARNFGVANPHDPKENIFTGARYLKHLIMLFDKNITLALAAYHAGEERVIRDGRIPKIPETEEYVKSVMKAYHALVTGR